MAKLKKKNKVKWLVGSTVMDIVKDNVRSGGAAMAAQSMHSMDTAEVVVTDSTPASKFLSAAGGRIGKKGPEKRKAVKLQKQKAVMKAISLIEKQERRVTQAELKKYGKQELKKME
ncbi:unnamed protein product [Calypogeia fissa]